MFRRKASRDLDEYIPDYEPFWESEGKPSFKLPEGISNAAYDELSNLIDEYWAVLHPMIQDYIISWHEVGEKIAETMESAKKDSETASRRVRVEQNNLENLNTQIKEIRSQLSNESLIRRDLEERLKDETTQIKKQADEEKKALENIIASKFDLPGGAVEGALKQAMTDSLSTSEVEKMKTRMEKAEEELERAKGEFERIQAEVSDSFQKKVLDLQMKVSELEEELASK
ncbi:MAG: hypothetical protein KAR35_11100 [Candidatus Heimdallarchaeota archaeon]|nr:hypothetical protein [Candidatus Heimdallarchaeota archaeon]MCK5049907.1 hypothetical protein [Candidatus Heimdallarchaeota archaeon]